MDLRERLLALLRPTSLGEELAPGLRLVDASTELGLRLTFETGDDELHVEVAPLALGLRHAARSARLGFAYRSTRDAPVDPALGRRVCALVAGAVARNEDAVLDALDAGVAAEAADGARIRELRGGRLLELAGPPGARFHTLSPYRGCLIGCRFCYAQSRLDPMRALLRLPQIPWGSYVDVRVDAPELLAAELRATPRHPIKFCPIVSDPYQAVERRYQLTRRCLQAIVDADDPPPTLVLTRSDLARRDLDLFAAIPRAFLGASIPTLDDDARAHFEPRAAPIADRLAMLRAFKEAGIRRCAVVQPLLPGPIDPLADASPPPSASASSTASRGPPTNSPIPATPAPPTPPGKRTTPAPSRPPSPSAASPSGRASSPPTSPPAEQPLRRVETRA